MAAHFITYVDDSKVTAGSSEEMWRAEYRVGSIWKYLGLQHTSRNRRIVGKDGGMWRGTKARIIDGPVYQLIGEGECTKTQIIIGKWLQRVTSEEPLNYKELQSDRVFPNYVFDTYKSCRPFLKGMHITLDSWRPHQDP